MSKSTLTEKKFQESVIHMARLHRWLVYHTHDSRRSQPGFPDLTMVRHGKLIFAELKTDKGKLTKDQAWWLAGLKQAHPDVFVWRPSDWREIEKILL